jgi:uncharacterized membrane protein YcaP (DUF421 family)
MGKRQIGELEVGEVITTFLLSEIIALPITDTNLSLLAGAIPAIFIFSAEILISAAKNRFNPLKRVVDGSPVYIIYKGKLLQSALKENRISIEEFLCSLRSMSIFSIDSVEYAILEMNGTVSVLLKDEELPLTKKSRLETSEGMAHAIVVDGSIQRKALRLVGRDEKWLEKYLRARDLSLSDTFLLTLNDHGDVQLIEKEKK